MMMKNSKTLTYAEFLNKLRKRKKKKVEPFNMLDQNIKIIRKFKDYSIFDTGSIPANLK